MTKSLSIVICTYNRSEVLKLCLESLNLDELSEDFFELIVVDNNSTDNTAQIVKQQSMIFPIMYVKESNQGLSYSRNTGVEKCSGKWVGFLDDDVILPNNFVNNIMDKINCNFEIFGCRIISEYLYKPKPRWLGKNFETNLIDGKCEIWGGAMFFKKEILPEIPFSIKLGMKGKELGYGEESELIQKLLNDGYRSTFDKVLTVKHIVNQEKYKMSWHWNSANKRAFADAIQGKFNDISKLVIMLMLLKAIAIYPFSFLKQFFFKKDYYFENLIIDWLSNIYYFLGVLKAKAT